MTIVFPSLMSKEYRIAEAPGLYGTFSVGEKLIQKIWNNGDFMNKNLQTLEGEKLIILNSGKWNLADEGPDFKGATISFDGEKISGDVEIHFRRRTGENTDTHKILRMQMSYSM